MLEKCVIPDTITVISASAFDACSNLTNVTFENTTGWQVYTSSNMTNPVSIDSTNLANTSTTVTYLTKYKNNGGYCDYYWKRS